MKMQSYILVVMVVITTNVFSLPFQKSYVTTEKNKNNFPVVENKTASPLWVDENDYPGIIRVSKHLQADIDRVTGVQPELLYSKPQSSEVIIIGSKEKSKIIAALVKSGKITAKELQNKPETFLITVINNPFPAIKRALVIAGSDKRGTIYGMYDLSEQMGVSPWYWWADIPPKKKKNVYVLPGKHSSGTPKIKYRGIFINDEAPALTGWAYEKFGGLNHKFYEHVFELIMRLKGNFLWPAMWSNSFATDDTLNPIIADEYGVVISTSHHEPMMRAWKEWEWAGNPKGSWDYTKNADKLREFWREGIRRSKNFEKVITLAMRGDGDEPMSEEANIALLEQIVRDQRNIIEEVTEKKATEVPQVWALYKEVQEYYEKGMRIPDDVILLLCDDNWGNLRILPKLTESKHKGGYGIYYHYDFVGGPRNYKWLNTNQIERVWEQMNLAYHYGAHEIWIVNVGDIKPMEYPISFFFDFAWNPEAITADKLPAYTREWAEKQFGPEFKNEIAEILEIYTKYNSRRKPEMLNWDTYSLVHYREYESVVDDYKKLETKATAIAQKLPREYYDAYYQLILHPVEACANLNEMYYMVARNYLAAQQQRASTNYYAEKVKELFKRDAEITNRYHSLGNGRWNHMMSQAHIGYTSWQQPDSNIMPHIKFLDVPRISDMGVMPEGCKRWFPEDTLKARLPEYDSYNQQVYYVELFNRGSISYEFFIEPSVPWIIADKKSGNVTTEERIYFSIDWSKLNEGEYEAPVTIKNNNNQSVTLYITVKNNCEPERQKFIGFLESNGYVAFEAPNYSRAINSPAHQWFIIPNLGRTSSAITIEPVTNSIEEHHKNSARLEYDIYFTTTDTVDVYIYMSPTLNFKHGRGLRYGVSFDNEPVQIINIHENEVVADWKYPAWWNKIVSESIRISKSKHFINKKGKHTLKIWALDPGIVLQRVVINTGGLKPSYLGPPQSYRIQ